MPRFYFDFHDDGGTSADETGAEFPSREAAQREALETLGIVLAILAIDAPKAGWQSRSATMESALSRSRNHMGSQTYQQIRARHLDARRQDVRGESAHDVAAGVTIGPMKKLTERAHAAPESRAQNSGTGRYLERMALEA